MIFELDNVELYFKNKRILGGIYIKAETGYVTSILGHNGCGKSCLMNIAFGNLKPKYKLVRLDHKAFTKPLYLSGFAKLLPQYNFVPVGMKVSFIFKLYHLDWKVFSERYKAFKKYETSKSKILSGGERRLLETYIILKSKSKIVFLDEPFSHIAPIYIDSIKELIINEKQNKVIVLSDHIYRHIIDCSDTIYLLKNGTTKEIQKLSELEDYKYLSEGSL